jgi:hypothetical protein
MTRKNITHKAEHRLDSRRGESLWMISISIYDDDDDDGYLEYYSGKRFHINYSVYRSYVKHINSDK